MGPAMNSTPILELTNVSKRFPGVNALKNVNLTLNTNEILGLAGENGAGKSTLIKILGGVHQPDEGSIELYGKQTEIQNSHAAIEMGISIIYQELSLVPELSVAENLYLGALPKKQAGRIDFKTLYENSREILNILGLDISPKTKVGGLGISIQQLVEIGKALVRDAKILIMDEPTSSLGREDAERLFLTMKNLKQKGYGIIFISHRLNELFGVTDHITVLRDGEIIETRPTKTWDMDSLVFAMVNRKIDQFYPKREVPIGEKVLTTTNLENKLIHDISFSIRAGEIVGISGLMGSGRSELVKTIYGVYRLKKGNIQIDGKQCRIDSPQSALKHGIALVPENRKAEGLVLESTVKENVVMSVLKKISRFTFISVNTINKITDYAVKYFDIRTSSRNQKVIKLSGGNQQKIVFARIAETNPRILLLDEPTRGIDIGSKVEIYNKIMDFAEKGTAIIIVSSDILEILGLTDRVLVMKEGTIVVEVNTKDADSKIIMDYATGGK
ncbi:MAG: D-xylose ABC transporter ATP-binding protein [Firmicutes bacterium HGW-Firmicutes-16]|nr:MAG: D-xylose ABC transporter ATP-binding protein [Firmicutes bacterium HGW-Firmicutes-16]